jgi:drug/metabolite transporter (DMT)-like permease
MIVAYGCANLLQSVAARRAKPHHSMHPSLLLRLACQRVYMAGIGFQVLGFGLAFVARRDLPLFLVQASITAGLGVMAILGVVLLRWRLPRTEIALLGLLGLGIGALVISAKPGEARRIHLVGVVILAAVLILIGVLGIFAVRLRGVRGSVVLGALAGLAFGAAAVDSRALAGAQNWHAFLLHPLLYLLFAHALVGQLLLGMAMQRGSTTAAVAAMDAASTAPAAIIGLAMLGDQIWPGRQWLAAVGFTCTLVAVIALARFAQPLQKRAITPRSTVVASATIAVPVSGDLLCAETPTVTVGAHRAVPFSNKRAAAR